MSASSQPSQYNDKFNQALQWMWGDGFLSPGGAEEVKEMLEASGGVGIAGADVLEVGCGLGAAAVMLINDFGASSVFGLDVEAHLIAHCRERAERAGLAGRTSFELVEPGPLPVEDSRFDVVFSKDAIVHIPDKTAFYGEVMRVLKPGGWIVASDWLRGGEATFTPKAREWLEFVHLNFQMQQGADTVADLEAAGFESVALNDRNDWYQGEIIRELASLEGDRFKELETMIGADEAAYRLKNSRLKKHAIDDGFLRPTHIKARKPSR